MPAPDSVSRTDLYPPVEPYASGRLRVDAMHQVYWEESGNPRGIPVVFLHGGPGAGATPAHRRFFDPGFYRIVVFDQRGAGRSTPHGELTDNTTPHLIADMEALRRSRNIESWVVFGGSWGSTLALAYAEKYPERVTELVLRGIYMCTRPELEWFYQFGVSEMFPDKWEKFVEPIPVEERHDMMAAYHRLLTGTDHEKQIEAAVAWSSFEGQVITLLPEPATSDHFLDPEFALAFARIENNYFVNGCWFDEGQLLRDANKLQDIPGTIVHGRYDMPCPAKYAWALHKAWPKAEFKLIEGAGHAYTEPGILNALITATDQYAGKR